PVFVAPTPQPRPRRGEGSQTETPLHAAPSPPSPCGEGPGGGRDRFVYVTYSVKRRPPYWHSRVVHALPWQARSRCRLSWWKLSASGDSTVMKRVHAASR